MMNGGIGIAAVLAGARHRAEQRIVRYLMMQHAISAADASRYLPERALERQAMERMISRRTMHRIGADRYWIDLPAYDADKAVRQQRLSTMIIIVCVLIAVGLLSLYRG